MKKITLLLFTFMAFQFGNAQEIVWSDNFDDEDISDWTVTDVDGDGNVWGDLFQIGDGAGGFVTPVSLISRSWQGSPLFPDNWVVSPAIDLSQASGAITVEYITQVAAADWDEEKYSIHVGTSNDITVLVNSATSLTETLGDPGDTGTPVAHSFDISSLAGSSTVYVAFRHWDSTDEDFLSIDDVTVTAAVLSVDEFNTNNFNNFYDSRSKVLTLSSAVSPLSQVVIHNILGQEVLNKNLSQTTETLNLSSLEDGVYFVRADMNSQSKTFRLLKK